MSRALTYLDGRCFNQVGVPNPRVLDACAAEALMPTMLDATVAELREAMKTWQSRLLQPVDPEDLLDQVEKADTGYVQLMFTPDVLHCYDAVFYPTAPRGSLRPPVGRTGPLEERVDHGRRVCPSSEVDLHAVLGKLLAPRHLEAYGNKVRSKTYIETMMCSTLLLCRSTLMRTHARARRSKRGLMAILQRNFAGVKAEITRELEENLPRYAVPKLLKAVDSIPLLQTGKVDRRALPDPTGDMLAKPRDAIVKPASDAEAAVFSCWQQVFPGVQFGVTDNFGKTTMCSTLLLCHSTLMRTLARGRRSK